MYNLYHLGTKVNSKPLTYEQAEREQSSCIINYGYSPTIVSIEEEGQYLKDLSNL